jgi:hypothetical protein
MVILTLKLITISIKLKFCSKYNNFYLQSNLSYVTFQENSEIWSHKTGGITEILLKVVLNTITPPITKLREELDSRINELYRH